jgi:hypothetical protein
MEEKKRIQRYIQSKQIDEFSLDNTILLISGYADYVDPLDDELYFIKKYIKENKLDLKSRLRVRAWQRAYIFKYLRTHFRNMSLDAIGNLVNKDHACVIHGIRLHDNMTETKDKVYSAITDNLSKTFKI